MLSIKLIGLEKLKGKLKADTVKKPLKDGLKKMTLLLEGFVKKETPVDTGRLRAGIFSKFGENEGLVGTHVAYAEFVEYGTVKMAPRGMFAKGLKQLMSKMGEQLRGIAVSIERRFGR